MCRGGNVHSLSPQPSLVFRLSYYWTTFPFLITERLSTTISESGTGCIVCKDSSKKKICVHIWTFCKWSLNSWPHIILAQRCKSYANVTFPVIATDSKSSAISVFALEQIWAKLSKCGICYTFAVVWLPVQIHFFVQCMIAFEKQLYLT